ncbi:hypothetical protein IC582_004038 [Cucumis melo]
MKAICNYCGKKLGGESKNGTKHLHDHFKICPLRRQRDIRQSCLKPTKTNEEKLVLNSAIFYYEASRRDLACAIILHEYPINMVEHKGFRKFLSGVQPMFKMISRSTMRRDIIKIYEEERIKTLKFLESNKSRVALTTDTWTATSQKKGYMAITAHFIDDSWVLQMKDGLTVISDGIEKIRGTVHFLTISPKRKEKFKEGVRQLQIPCTKKLFLDCVTRWNSTYVMLKTALEYKDVFPRLRQREPLYTCLYLETDWNFAKEMCDRLEPFYLMTELFSGSSYPTSNVFFEEVCEIRLELSKWLNSDIEEIQVMASSMISKFEKYWSVIHGVLAITTVLDPRFKMRLIEFYFPQIYGSHYTIEIKRVRELCCDLMTFYSSKSSTKEEPQRSTSTSYLTLKRDGSSSKISLPNKKDRHLKFEEFVSNVENDVNNVKSKLDRYLDESLLPRTKDFNILQWWKLNGVKYNVLYEIAKDVLAVPITTVASESAFSIGGRHVGPHRSQIHENLLEALMCTQDWLWAEDKHTPIDAKVLENVLHDRDLDDDEPFLTEVDKIR